MFCKCGWEKYVVFNVDSVLLVLCDFFEKDIYFFRLFDIYCGEYYCMVYGYY